MHNFIIDSFSEEASTALLLMVFIVPMIAKHEYNLATPLLLFLQ